MDWTGNKKSIFSTLGASNHSEHEREKNDYYATDPIAMEELLKREQFQDVWECACGEGHLAKVLENKCCLKRASDLIYRNYGDGGVDFLSANAVYNGDIITNPPYKYAQEFVEKALDILQNGRKLALFLKLTFLEGQKRRKMFNKYPPRTIYVFSARKKCALNGDFANTGSSAAAYGWFVWEKGYTGKPQIEWI